MRFAADLHLHSRWSRATSGSADLEGYHAWALVKGVTLLGTGDFTHPRWLADLGAKLVERDGLLELKQPPRQAAVEGARPAHLPVRFILTTEISSIYKKHGATRKVHSVVVVPTLEAARRLAARLGAIGNVASDGRPILGLDPKDLLAIVLEVSPDAFLIPAHVWTPWFSLFGSKSGFDRIEECFEDLTPQVFALETGLSSDPPMNWRWSALDRYRLVSCSDAHSPANLGREATVFDTELSWPGVVGALRTGRGFLGTHEFFPEEGKYHFDGHRACGVCQDPAETRRRGEACPSCGKPLTVGVLNRVLALCDRDQPVQPRPAEGFRSLIPLPELLSELLACGPDSHAVQSQYARIVTSFGNEYAFLLEAPLEGIASGFGPALAEAVRRMRAGQVEAAPGFDGQFGTIRVFAAGERERFAGQDELFARPTGGRDRAAPGDRERAPAAAKPALCGGGEGGAGLDPDQSAIVEADSPRILVQAGPGAGKTRVLTAWIARRVEQGQVAADRVLAVTFTNRAAAEMRERLAQLLGARASGVTVATFHAYCFSLLRERTPALSTVYGDRDREELLRLLLPADRAGRAAQLNERIARCLEGVETPDAQVVDLLARYRQRLAAAGAVDVAAIVADAVTVLEDDPAFLGQTRGRLGCIAIDELQDINRPQYELLRLLAGAGERAPLLLAIGDPDQAIYGFRGSDRTLFSRFAEEFRPRLFTLERNYRSTATIVAAAGAIIGRTSPDQAVRPGRTSPFRSVRPGRTSPFRSVRPEGPAIRLLQAADPAAEAASIAAAIEQLVGGVDHVSVEAVRDGAGGWSFSDIAVLFRTKAVRDAMLPVFERVGLPFTLREAAPVSGDWPWRGAIAGLRLIANPGDRVALAEIVGRPARALPRDARVLLGSADSPAGALDSLERRGMADGAAIAFASGLLVDRDQWLARIGSGGVLTALEAMIGEVAPEAAASGSAAPAPESLLAAELLRETAREEGADLAGFLHRLSLSPLESEGSRRTERLRLLTFHAAKGLEFPAVFIAGAEEGITPLARAAGGEDDEERRLFYVAITRARELLCISYCARRRIHGQDEERRPSRFLAELPERLARQSVPQRRAAKADGQLSLF